MTRALKIQRLFLTGVNFVLIDTKNAISPFNLALHPPTEEGDGTSFFEQTNMVQQFSIDVLGNH